jgi:hypothetical protein
MIRNKYKNIEKHYASLIFSLYFLDFWQKLIYNESIKPYYFYRLPLDQFMICPLTFVHPSEENIYYLYQIFLRNRKLLLNLLMTFIYIIYNIYNFPRPFLTPKFIPKFLIYKIFQLIQKTINDFSLLFIF